MKKTFKFSVIMNDAPQTKEIPILGTLGIVSAALALLTSYPDAVILGYEPTQTQLGTNE